MAIPTISLALIAKNEEKNVNRLLDSVDGCFDEIIFVDTGSTDKTKELAEKRGCKVFDFAWINSFCAARNFAFSKATSDFIVWCDLDDVLYGRDNFLQWKKTAMEFTDATLACYNYALDENKKPVVSFIRERVFKRSLNPVWQYPLHEGIVIKNEWRKDVIPSESWGFNHLRDAEDIKADKSRNIKILEELRDKQALEPRLKFYYGKELFEIQEPAKAIAAFEEALKDPQEIHDKMLCYQYLAYASFQCAQQIKNELVNEKNKYLDLGVNAAVDGLKLDPNRAEFHVIAGDIYLAKGEIAKAIPHYAAAKHCLNPKENGSPYEGAIYSFLDCYNLNPRLQLARCYFHIGKLKEAKKEAKEAWIKYKDPQAKAVLDEVIRCERLTRIENNQEQTEDIVFTTPPATAYPFDEDMYKTNPLGGSETALVQVAKHLKQLTGRTVKVFQMREKDMVSESGVEYLSNRNINEYFSKYRPKVHIAWRHNIRLTKAPTYLWCHDLVTPSVEAQHNFDKILCLSKFHKDYVMAKQSVPSDKIIITDNGIDPEKFKFERKTKNPNKLVWMSSPDRGLEQAILVCDELLKEFPDLELHVYYGLDNLYKYGLADMANKLKDMMAYRDYVKYHGFTEQKKMYKEVSNAVVWCHPCNFIETNCITAKEMLALGIYPVTRSLGALKNTLDDARQKGQAILLDHPCDTEEQIRMYAVAIKHVLTNQNWKRVSLDVEKYSWRNVALQWCEFMGLERTEERVMKLVGGEP